MDNFWTAFWDVLRLAIPAIAVSLTIYYVLRQLLNAHYASRQLEVQQSRQQTTLPLRLQAYERLSLFCERIAIPSLVLRHRQEDQSATVLRITLLLAIQQEFEHNITQQVYVSDQLWQIIKAARDDSSQIIDLVAAKLEPQASGLDFAKALFSILEQRSSDPIAMAQNAIRREVASLF